MSKLTDIIDSFHEAEPEMRLEMLLDYARKLPSLPPAYRAQRDAGVNRVPECMTPVYLWIELDDRKNLRVIADVAEEAPTVKGFVALLAEALAGQPPAAAADVPPDLFYRLGLADMIRMNRVVGLTAVTARIKRQALALGNGHHAPQ